MDKNKLTLQWLGHSCFQLTSGSGFRVVMDPYDPTINLVLPQDLTAELVTTSHDHRDHGYTAGVTGPFIHLREPGVFTHQELTVKGVLTDHDEEQGSKRGKNILYAFTLAGLTLVHLGDLGHVPTPEQLAQLGRADILLIPVGGFYTMPMEAVLKTIEAIQPTVIVPMHYRYGKLDFPIVGLEAFLEQLPQAPVHRVPVLSLTRDELDQYRGIVVLEDALNG